jgi:hypothetical protein
MLNEIIRATVSAEPDMTIVEDPARDDEELGTYTRRRRIDVVIFVAGDKNFADDKIVQMLRINPRLRLLSMDGKCDRGTLHHLVPAHDAIGRLAQSTLTAALRTGAALRLN